MAMAVVYATFGGQIVHENRGGVERRYLADPLGSTIALTDSGTAITDTWDYWPYGEVMSRTGTNPTPFTFVGVLGYFKDLMDKLFYVRARHYQPNYGRWLTVDPLWPGESAYCYSRCSPPLWTDESGLQVRDPWIHLDPWIEYQQNWNRYLNECIRPAPPPLDPCAGCMRDAQSEAAEKLRRVGLEDPGWFSWMNSVGHCVAACIIKRRCPACFDQWQQREYRAWWNPDSQRDICNNWMGFVVAHSGKQCVEGCLESPLHCWPGFGPPRPKPGRVPPPVQIGPCGGKTCPAGSFLDTRNCECVWR